MPSERVQRRIDRLLDQIDQAEVAEDWVRVKNLAQNVLDVDEDNDEALAYLAAADRWLATGETEAAPSTVQPVAAQSASEDSSTDPTSFASGRYPVSKFLGEGGKKKVYLAHDNTLDRDVAFALIKIEGLDGTSRERVKREAQAMGRMGTHPCIIPIYDLGEEIVGTSTQPYMVQPVMVGGDVEGLIEDAEGPLELDRAITIATQTAQGLSFAHGKGIVHRDLKPGNVWLDDDGAAKIGDFGLAVATDRSRLTVEKVMVGTVSYMPPEQATGGEVTPRADLYSLGAMLYEMCTGRVPFMGDDDIGIISQHINTPPVAPSWHNSQIPKTLDSLILRLLAKDPVERPATADEVLAALQAVDLTAVEDREEGSKGSLDAMAGGVFVGRHREMDQLKAAFEDVLTGKGRMVTLVGEPGIGKTRTAQELATYAGMRGAEVLWGRSYESGGAPPYWPWVQAIRNHVAAIEPDDLRRQLGATAPVIAEVVSDVKTKLPDIPAPTPIEDPESARFRLFDSISTFLKNTAASTPLVLMLEDLHWSDKPSLMLLEFVARELANSRILIVGNYRDMELNRRHPLSVTLGDLNRERLFERVVLRGLQKHDVQWFIEIAAGITPPPALVDTVHAQTEGNPLFVTETVRLLIQEGEITSGQSSKGGTTSWEIRIPEGVREVIGRRLDRLSERCNEGLTIAAVIGRQFRFDVLKTLAEDTTDNQLLDAMDEALSARIIEELPDDVGLYQFTHASMQETLTLELSANRLVRMHARIAEALEEYYDDEVEANAAELVEHFAEAETILGVDKLVMYGVAAGERALEAYAWEDAQRYFDAAISANPLGDGGRMGRAWVGLGICQLALIDMVDGFNSLLKGARLLLDANEQARIRELAHLPYGAQSSDVAIELHEILLQVTPEDSEEHAYVLGRSAVQQAFRNRLEYSAAALKEAEKIARSTGSADVTAWTQTRMALIDYLRRDYDSALSNASTPLERGLTATDHTFVVNAVFWSTMSALTLGDPERIVSYLPQGLKAADTLRDHFRQSQANGSVFTSSLAKGEFEICERHLRKMAGENMSMLRCVVSMLVDGEIDRDAQVKTRQAFSDFAAAMPEAPGRPGVVNYLTGVAWVASHVQDEDLINMVEGFSRKLMSACSEVPRLVFEANASLTMTALARSDVADATLHAAEIEVGPEVILSTSTVQSRKHLLGRVAALSGDTEKAELFLSEGREDMAKAGYLPGQALATVDYSDLLLERNAPGDREKAIELQDEAISIATELGMKPLLERVLAKREILKA